MMLVDMLNSVKGEIDIYNGLNDTQKASLNEIMEKYQEGDKNGNKVIHEDLDEEAGDDNNEIINKIEEIVNDNFSKKLIKNIQINQISDTEYEFNGKSAVLSLEENILRVTNGGNALFEKWIIDNFPLNDTKATPTATGGKKPASQEKIPSKTTPSATKPKTATGAKPATNNVKKV